MKRFFPSILVMTTLLIAPGCLSNTKSPKSEVSPSMMMNHDGNSINEHEGHSMENKHHTNNSQITTKVKLTAPQKLAPNQPINLVIDIQDSTGNPVNKFEIFPEKLMHIIVGSDDLRLFDHIHPDYIENGRFEVTAN
ncbi:MAG: hypothetical protein ACK51W_15015, partial [Aphanizomenon sp.]